MDVSIIILTRNTCSLTGKAIESVLNGFDDFKKEIVIVDNGSTDETAVTLVEQYPDMHYIRSETNLGFAHACNLAAKSASGEFLLLLNSDARVAPDAIEKSLTWMRQRPDTGVAGAQLLNPDSSPQNSIANFPTLMTELLNKSLLRRLWPKKYPGKEHFLDEPLDVETVIGAFFLVRKSVWDLLGGLDEHFFFFFEETDFCLRARKKNCRVVHLPGVHVWHGQGQTARQVFSGARIEYWRSRYFYFAKNHCILTRFILIVCLLVKLFFDWWAAGLLTLGTLGKNARWRSRWRVCSALATWHLSGCSVKMGLPR
jgi:GT2 family glycosyltransferase